MRETSGGWTLEDEAAAGAIGGHGGTHRAEGLASGDTLGGTKEAAHEEPEEPGPALDTDWAAEEGAPVEVARR